ncbi:hypothetical protein [Ralstonia solanacearum]|uniref:hypothetical protein n=1 Tax=Ralstonia solanacearum TaxID=305 RepID=UPI000F615C9A|nr:hypothetical protein [Ralstonia solanacearum]MCL9844598.1 hypothetical protein [Ralstonia solanacearum]MDC6253184.1 hypothetical protein [Ralstonia solanacearum]MDC6258793.1 hypothetical protein [Ralstonia solanacearum]MDC6301578.1 hypothetical protein [Ralstonia solanacearum]
MEIVGDHLIAEVFRQTDDIDKDLFGRSAFNRYYYAAFLAIRRLFAEVDNNLNQPQHAGIPSLLTDTLNGKIKKIVRRQEKAGAISSARAQEICNSAAEALKSLAELMSYAYSIRKIADYQPETKIELVGGVVGIGGCQSTVARRWCADVEVKAEQVREIWRQLGN